LKINSRKILAALAEKTAGIEKLTDITVAIDKLDKIGLEKVKDELLQRGLNETHIKSIETYLGVSGSNTEKLAAIGQLLEDNETGRKGIEELQYVVSGCGSINLSVDFTLARGLNYYTGIILEAVGPSSVKMGSIGGGGRYDDLTGLFGVKDIPGAGISFGIDRIYDVMEELSLFPENTESKTKAVFFNLGEKESEAALIMMQSLRDAEIACELYPDFVKLDKQFKYAEAKRIPYAVIIGSRELEGQTCIVKTLATGIQQNMPLSDLKIFLTNNN
jgi:histidyl-tRNA synthetase